MRGSREQSNWNCDNGSQPRLETGLENSQVEVSGRDFFVLPGARHHYLYCFAVSFDFKAMIGMGLLGRGFLEARSPVRLIHWRRFREG